MNLKCIENKIARINELMRNNIEDILYYIDNVKLECDVLKKCSSDKNFSLVGLKNAFEMLESVIEFQDTLIDDKLLLCEIKEDLEKENK